MALVEVLVIEMKTRPFSMLMLIGIYVVLLATIFTNYGLASEPQVLSITAQLQAATSQVTSLSNTVKRTSIDTRLDQKRAELFTWQQKVTELNNAKKPVDPLYVTHINELNQEIADLQRERDALR